MHFYSISGLKRTYGPVTRFFLMNQPAVLLSSAEAFEVILSGKYITKGPNYK
jgi:hypothetical protein